MWTVAFSKGEPNYNSVRSSVFILITFGVSRSSVYLLLEGTNDLVYTEFLQKLFLFIIQYLATTCLYTLH